MISVNIIPEWWTWLPFEMVLECTAAIEHASGQFSIPFKQLDHGR